MPGGLTQNQQQQNQNVNQGGWAPSLPYLQTALGASQGAFNQASAGNAATQPTGFVAGLTPQQIQTFNQMVGYGSTNPNPAIESATGANLTNSGASNVNQALAGLSGYNPFATNNTGSLINAANQYVQGYNIPAEVQNAMLAANQEAGNVTLPGIDQAAAATGNVNSSRAGIAQGLVQQGLAEQAANLSGTLQNQAYSNALGLASNTAQANNAQLLQGLSNYGSLAGNTANTGLGALSQGISDQGNLFNIAGAGGSGLQQGNQLTFNNQLAANQFANENPYAPLQGYLNSILPIAQTGQSGTNTTTTTTTPSALSVIGGLLGAGGSLLGSSGGALGGGSGLLGWLKPYGR